MKTTILFISILMIMANTGMSQDTIYKKSGEIISVKIINRDRNQISYTIQPDPAIKKLSNDSVKFIKMAGDNFTMVPKPNGGSMQDNGWQFKDVYSELRGEYKAGMTDEQIAGELLIRGGENIRNSGIIGLTSILLGVSTTFIPNMITDPGAQKNAIYVVSGAAGVLGIFSIAELISGGNKIIRSGIILQHKRVQVTPTSMVIKL